MTDPTNRRSIREKLQEKFGKLFAVELARLVARAKADRLTEKAAITMPFKDYCELYHKEPTEPDTFTEYWAALCVLMSHRNAGASIAMHSRAESNVNGSRDWVGKQPVAMKRDPLAVSALQRPKEAELTGLARFRRE